jgi:hypothetical protein
MTGLSPRAVSHVTVEPSPEPVARPRPGGPSVSAVLSAIFNVMALNAVVLLGCLPIITAPVALQSGVLALQGWRRDGEDRVVRGFLAALRSRPFARTTLAVGAPMLAAVVAGAEMEFFARRGSASGALGLGFGAAGLMLAFAGLGYALALGARWSELSASDVWYLSVALTVRNLLGTSPLLVAEFLAGAFLTLRDPALTVIGLPIALLAAVRVTADRGVSRAGDELLEAAESERTDR